MKIYLLFFLVLLLFSCKDGENKIDNTTTISHVQEELNIEKEWMKKPLVFPDSIFSILQKDLSLKDYRKKSNTSDYTFVSFIDYSCNLCVDMDNLNAYFNKHDIFNNTNIVLITSGDKKPMIDYHLYDVAKFKYDVFYDEKNDFFTKNSLHSDKKYHSFLLKGDEVVSVGFEAIAKKIGKILNEG